MLTLYVLRIELGKAACPTLAFVFDRKGRAPFLTGDCRAPESGMPRYCAPSALFSDASDQE